MAYAVLTRDQDSAAIYADVIAPLEAIAMPVTRTEEPEDRNALLRAVELGGYSAIICASSRAAMALLGVRGHAPLPEVWAVGPATARILEAARVPALIPAVALDGATLARELLALRQLVGKKVLIPRAEDGRNEVIEILRDAGVVVDAVTAYRTVPVGFDDPAIARGREMLASGEAAVCIVFAPSQVAALDSLIELRTIATPFVAIGETTAVALREAGATVVQVAETPTPEGIAKAVAAVYPATR